MDKAGVQQALTSAGLSRLVEHIDLLVRPSIRINTKSVDESKLPIGASKFGGQPDLPPATPWPSWQDLPQSFVAQIRLEELQPYDSQKLFPTKGILWFFYDSQQDVYGDDPANKGAWQVLYATDSLDKLQRTPLPAKLAQTARFKPSSLSYSNELTMAVQPELEIPGLQ